MVKRCKILFLAIVSYFGTVGYLDAAGVRNYTAVTNVSFHNLTYIPSNFLDHAFGESENYYEQNVPTLPTIQRIDFHSATGLNTHAQLYYGILGFGICTNLRYAAFDSLKSGVVNLDDVTAPLVVSCSNIAKSAVVNVSDCTNLREIRFDTVPAIVNYDSRWIPQNADFSVYVPARLYNQWILSQGWSQYATNFVSVVPSFTKWTTTSEDAVLAASMNATPSGGAVWSSGTNPLWLPTGVPAVYELWFTSPSSYEEYATEIWFEFKNQYGEYVRATLTREWL